MIVGEPSPTDLCKNGGIICGDRIDGFKKKSFIRK